MKGNKRWTSFPVIQNYYAAHIKKIIDALAINFKKIKYSSVKKAGALTVEEE